jgi:secretion/DNA translocation related TadE-like protein
VWALALIQVLLLVVLAVSAVAGVALARQRAATVADLAAVAGAQAAGDPCAQAHSMAIGNGLTLASCTVEGLDVLVAVTAPAPGVVTRLFTLLGRDVPTITQRARAGPPAP